MARWTLEQINCFMRKVQEGPIKLVTSPTGLYLINMIDICVRSETATVPRDLPMTFLSNSVPEIPNGDRLGYENHKNSIMGKTEGVLQSQKSTQMWTSGSCETEVFAQVTRSLILNRASEPRDSHAAHGQHAQDDCRGHHSPADLAPSDLCASVGKSKK